MAVAGSTLYAGEASGIEAVDLESGDVTAFSAANGAVSALAATCNRLCAGGAFTMIGGLPLVLASRAYSDRHLCLEERAP